MNIPAIARKKTGTAVGVAKIARTATKNRTKRKISQVQTPKIQPAIKVVPLLLERFPEPETERISLGLYAPAAQEVFVAGSFNGWRLSDTPLQKQDSGHWVVELVLTPGRYEYRFFVDGHWTDDPLSPAYVSNPFGSLNCVLLAGHHASSDPQ